MLAHELQVPYVAPLLVALAACGSGSPHTVSNPSTAVALTAIAVSPSDATVPAGFPIHFTATGSYSDASTKDVTSSATWTAADTACAATRTDAADAFDTHATCATTITAKDPATGVSGSASLTVVSATLVAGSLAIAPIDPTLLIGATLQLSVTGILSDDSVANFTLLEWQSSDPTVASVGSDGLVTAIKAGTTTITATEPATSEHATIMVTVTNVPGVLSFLSLSPGSVVGGGTRTVIGTVALDSPAVVDKAVTLASSSAAATVPASITIAAGSVSATFQVTTLAVDHRTKVTITATTADAGDPVKTATLNVRKAH